jgi:SRSO17 transposase
MDSALQGLVDHLADYVHDYRDMLKTKTRDTSVLAEQYISGLLHTERGKGNIERMLEDVEIEGQGNGYQQVQHFITDSPWEATVVMAHAAYQTSALYASQPTYQEQDVGYIIDESAHLKKGTQSVGVARQYAGVIGKVDNCQVGVYASLVWQSRTTLINTRLYLPECWTEDDTRCENAGIPEADRVHKTKPQLGLEMLKADMAAGVQFGWVGGDGLYGHGYELSYAVDDLGLTFLFDVHCDQSVYLEAPVIHVPEKSPGRGRPPTRPKTDAQPITVKAYQALLGERDWQEVEVRDTTKGVLRLSMHVRRVWVWDQHEYQARCWTLVISRNKTEKTLKYSLSNADMETTPLEQFAYRQAQRYWVERSLQDAKSELGMSDYQVRKWPGWYHHMALVMLAMAFIVRERLVNRAAYPLLSCRDVRLLIIALLTHDRKLIDKRLEQMKKRHKQRDRDMQRHFKT